MVCFGVQAQSKQKSILNITQEDINNIKSKITIDNWSKEWWSKIKSIADQIAKYYKLNIQEKRN